MQISDKDRTRKKYEKPALTLVRLNPAQAVLSICHAAATGPMLGTVNMCRTGACRKAATSGNSVGHS